ncbi:hypothetical protein PY650_26835 [Rhizobium calliandrae]|uniref:Lipoprotein n=1 Tax=Rhizobium calliandrae TaxID=1312182 RepID=A0ABT7KKM0_9HYPH|nr:hypothetical protein [Rhizobium calliandrae]MDL2409185.1 hypothetical protein [Rhizobium calliandrae]
MASREFYRAALVSAMLFSLPALLPAIAQGALATEAPAAAEKNPPGDIPDNQVFISYVSPLGFSLKVPEGWARTDLANGASFVDKLDGVIVKQSDMANAPTAEGIRKDYIPGLEKEARAVSIGSVKAVKLPAGNAIRINYSSNSEPNAVTNKQVRLENQRFLFFRNGKLVALELYAPLGADNADQWKLMSESFEWH